MATVASEHRKLRALAPAKVNLGLFVGRVKANGRHGVATIYESVSLADEVTVERLPPGARDAVECEGVAGQNLAAWALAGLRAAGWQGPPLAVRITKRIPVAAGMGGGSADAAAVLRLALAITGETVSAADLQAVAAGLGADVPGQLKPGVTLGTGEGEIVRPLRALAEHAFVVVPSVEALSTAAVYGEFDRLGLGRDATDLERCERMLSAAGGHGAPVALGQECLINDLQRPALALSQTIAPALAAVRAAGADEAFVSGSGPTVLGIWWGDGAAERARCVASALAATYPGTCAAGPVEAGFWAPMTV